MKRKRLSAVAFAGLSLSGVAAYSAHRLATARMGRQSDGTFIVSSGQRVEPGTLAFDGRPIDLALHPSGRFFAVVGQERVFLARPEALIPGSDAPLGEGAAYHGVAWSTDGAKLYVSVSDGSVLELDCRAEKLIPRRRLSPRPVGVAANPRPGGLAVTRDGSTLFVACCDRDSVAEIDLATGKFVREFRVGKLPFGLQLTQDEQTLIVSNWGGREPNGDDETGETAAALISIDPRGAASNGTLSLISRRTAEVRHLAVGRHPTGLAVSQERVYVANSADDSVSVVNPITAKTERTVPFKFGRLGLFGSMPCALALSPDGKTLYVANGGDNALCEIDVAAGKVRGFRPAGYYPVALALSPDGRVAYVVNTKGNGSVRRTVKGEVGNAHDFQGTVSVLDLTADLVAATARVSELNGWEAGRNTAALRPKLAVYNGAIRHVLYIIKENRTYDEVFGDMTDAAGKFVGNGDRRLCGLGERITPNHHKLAREFTLFDNGYVSGTNSADGHAWSNQAIANDYLERFYTGYRTYPDDGDCAMAIPTSGNLWDAALRKRKTVRVYGEFMDDRLASFTPQPKDWLEMWRDRGVGRIKVRVNTRLKSLKNLFHPEVVYWPLLQSDQVRADLFLADYEKRSRANRVPNLMILSLPCDHTEGRDPKYPKPQSMVADNDLALGRVIEGVSKSPQWKNTCVFVIEDDAQSGPDHVDGHRTVYMAISPYVRRGWVDSSFYTTVSMLRSIELMLGLDPMNRFDALTPPLAACFTDAPDLTPYSAAPNNVSLDDMNPPMATQSAQERYWTRRSLALDWSGLDRADPHILNQVLWHTLHGVETPYPAASPPRVDVSSKGAGKQFRSRAPAQESE